MADRRLIDRQAALRRRSSFRHAVAVRCLIDRQAAAIGASEAKPDAGHG